ncbi:MAG: hypothetical protein AAB336_06445 [Acidobacteriota bacterium]
MKSIGQLVEETISVADRGLPEFAFYNACEALNQTAQMIYKDEELVEPAFQKFIRDNWRLISFMGFGGMEFPENLPFTLRRSVAALNMPFLAQEVVIYAVRHTLSTHQMPLGVGIAHVGHLRIENDKLLFPKNFLFAILGSVILNPINKNEEVADKFWISIWDFKMFISELWGRIDLAERVMNLYEG